MRTALTTTRRYILTCLAVILASAGAAGVAYAQECSLSSTDACSPSEEIAICILQAYDDFFECEENASLWERATVCVPAIHYDLAICALSIPLLFD